MTDVTHPSDGWERSAPRTADRPVLVIDGRRSIYAAWPPGAVCEICGTREPSQGGYVGPVAGEQVTYPDANTRFLCESCARAKVGLGDGELTGHACMPGCTDDLHVDVQSIRAGHVPRADDFVDDYARRGWRVVNVRAAGPGFRTMGHDGWEVWFTPSGPRP